MVEQFHLAERRTCRLVGLSRDSFRHPPQETEMNQALSAKIIEIAHVRRRFGYRRIHDLLRLEFAGANHKRVLRLYQQANLSVRKRRKVKRPASERVPLQFARAVNEVGSMTLGATVHPQSRWGASACESCIAFRKNSRTGSHLAPWSCNPVVSRKLKQDGLCAIGPSGQNDVLARVCPRTAGFLKCHSSELKRTGTHHHKATSCAFPRGDVVCIAGR